MTTFLIVEAILLAFTTKVMGIPGFIGGVIGSIVVYLVCYA
jgi:hypothetical protein